MRTCLRCMFGVRSSYKATFGAFDDRRRSTADNIHATHTEYELAIVDENIKNYNKVPSKFSQLDISRE